MKVGEYTLLHTETSDDQHPHHRIQEIDQELRSKVLTKSQFPFVCLTGLSPRLEDKCPVVVADLRLQIRGRIYSRVLCNLRLSKISRADSPPPAHRVLCWLRGLYERPATSEQLPACSQELPARKRSETFNVAVGLTAMGFAPWSREHDQVRGRPIPK